MGCEMLETITLRDPSDWRLQSRPSPTLFRDSEKCEHAERVGKNDMGHLIGVLGLFKIQCRPGVLSGPFQLLDIVTARQIECPRLGILRRSLWRGSQQLPILSLFLWTSDPSINRPVRLYRSCRIENRLIEKDHEIQPHMPVVSWPLIFPAGLVAILSCVAGRRAAQSWSKKSSDHRPKEKFETRGTPGELS